MKRIVSFLLAALLLCGCLPIAGAEEALTSVYCGEQDFSTKIPADKTAAWEENVGLRISVGTPGYVPYVAVYRRAMEDKFKNPVNFLNNVYREFMEESYNNNVGTNPCKVVEIGGKQLYSATYHYTVNNNSLCLTLMLEIRDDGDVEYYVKYVEGKGDAAMAVAETAIANYQPGQIEDASSETGLVDVHCDPSGFSTKVPDGAVAQVEDDGIFYVWLKDQGYVPNVYIVRREKKLSNPDNYIRSTYTNYMKDTYGENLKASTIFEYYDIGGKRLLGASYIYKAASGSNINQLFLVEIREDGDVEYTARYLNSEQESTLDALDAAVRYYQPDGAKAAAPAAQATAKPVMTAQATAAPSIVSGTRQYGDGRFSMTLPSGWQIMTSSEYTTFSFKAWDPGNPCRTIFFAMKLEPFLKSQAAKNTYIRVNNSLGGNSLYQLYADAPVMESCSLQGFLDAIPGVRDFCEKYFDSGLSLNPSVFPEITNARIVKKANSPLPAPSTCKENVIAHITFDNYLGQACEGIVTAQPLDTMSYDFYGVDGWPYSVYLAMGVTSPVGEMKELASVLTECLGSFAFEPSYVKKAVGISNEETQALLAQGEAMQAAHDAMVAAWSYWQ